MPMAEFGIFTMKDVDRLRILQDVIDRKLRPGQAAKQIGVTAIHFSRLLALCASDCHCFLEFIPITIAQNLYRPGVMPNTRRNKAIKVLTLS